MGLTYEEFKEKVSSRDSGFGDYGKIINDLSKLYNETEDFIFFYPRNLFNDKETRLIFFLKDGYLTIERVNEKIQYEQYKSKLLSKSLITDKYQYNEHLLKLRFDNGTEFIFSSTGDSDEYQVEYYTRAILDLYKII
ncbi:DUF3908 family protein [Bacillus cereus group sp. MYBK242-2]|uniref:DUF3908 family protein n=1 Tax=Bacillus cereus group sp. MYBK242-2 TaxID=3450647 RepID=UPI003F7A4921